MSKILFEACVDSLQSAKNAKDAGVDRLELCSELSVGGLTPSAGLIKAVKKLNIDVNVLIRSRSGDFCYNTEDINVMSYDIELAKDLGINGVVVGAITEDANIDMVSMKELINVAKPLNITFHRAFDLVADPYLAIEQLIDLGIDRVLTSGQAPSAEQGQALIKELNNKYKNKIIIMPGAGVSEQNIYEIVYNTGVKEIHGSGKAPISNVRYTSKKGVNMGFNDGNSNRYIASITRLTEMITIANRAFNDKSNRGG